ncbi:energy transducer TonB [Tenacibaculum agarivorans]|uniref:energy transducer TonB n=1 Tax=Tenacibaculum agarivorans TaxID=1908389 RepID=UPI00094B8B59|nr:energy transducer TonB [Tenacibaculum agarivorans]
MKKVYLLIVVLLSLNSYTQEVCESKEETSFEDLNSITKCSIKPAKKGKGKSSRQITVRVSASKRRFLKKREIRKKQAVSSANSLNTSGITEIAGSNTISNKLTVKKKTATNSIAALTASLSEEEVRNADRFNSVDKIPLFAKCKKVKRNEAYDCFNEEMINHIQEHFKYPGEAVRNKTEGEVWIRFIIDKNGDVRNIKALGPENAEILNDEAKRVVTKLPQFIAAKKNGKRVAVKYGFPINFSLEE